MKLGGAENTEKRFYLEKFIVWCEYVNLVCWPTNEDYYEIVVVGITRCCQES